MLEKTEKYIFYKTIWREDDADFGDAEQWLKHECSTLIAFDMEVLVQLQKRKKVSLKNQQMFLLRCMK